MENANSNIYEALYEWRRLLSREQSLPAYRILTNSTMQQLAFRLPDTPEDLLATPGIGPRTQEKYGQQILAVIRRNLRPGNIPVRVPETAMPFHASDGGSTPITSPRGGSRRFSSEASADNHSPGPEPAEGPGDSSRQPSGQVSFELFMDGMTLAEIARERHVSERTVALHLSRYVESGDIDIEELTTFEVVDRIASFKAAHPEPVFLRTIYRHFNGTIPYPDIRFALAYLTYTGYIPEPSPLAVPEPAKRSGPPAAPEPAEGPGPDPTHQQTGPSPDYNPDIRRTGLPPSTDPDIRRTSSSSGQDSAATPARPRYGTSEWLKDLPTEFLAQEDSAE